MLTPVGILIAALTFGVMIIGLAAFMRSGRPGNNGNNNNVVVANGSNGRQYIFDAIRLNPNQDPDGSIQDIEPGYMKTVTRDGRFYQSRTAMTENVMLAKYQSETAKSIAMSDSIAAMLYNSIERHRILTGRDNLQHAPVFQPRPAPSPAQTAQAEGEAKEAKAEAEQAKDENKNKNKNK